MENTVLFATEPKYLMDEEGFYWNPLCPENHLRFCPDSTLRELGTIRIPVRIFRDGKPVQPDGVLPEDIASSVRRLQ